MPVPAPLHNGQLYSWREVESYPDGWLQEANLPATWDLRGIAPQRVTDALHRLVALHEPLRTSYRYEGRTPVQIVHDAPALPIESADRVITDPVQVQRTTEALVAQPIPMTGGLCWRGELVSADGQPMFLSLSFSHLIVDVWSIIELGQQFRELVADPDSAAVAARIGPSPRELLARQREESRQDSAERYWRKVLTDDLVHRMPTLPEGVTKPRIQATLHSHQLDSLAAAAARAHGVTVPALIMSLVTAGLSAQIGADRVTLCLMSNNRFAAEFQHTVGTLNQLVPLTTTVDHRLSLAQHVKQLHWASARAYRHSSYDVDRIAAIAADTGATTEHDGWFNQLFPCWFNYLQFDGQAADPDSTEPAELVWMPTARQYGQPFDVRVTAQGGRTSVALRTDPDVIPAAGVLAVLRTIALGVQRALSNPDSSLKDLWSAHDIELPGTLFPAEAREQ